MHGAGPGFEGKKNEAGDSGVEDAGSAGKPVAEIFASGMAIWIGIMSRIWGKDGFIHI